MSFRAFDESMLFNYLHDYAVKLLPISNINPQPMRYRKQKPQTSILSMSWLTQPAEQ